MADSEKRHFPTFPLLLELVSWDQSQKTWILLYERSPKIQYRYHIYICTYMAILKMYHVSFLINIYQWLPITLRLKPQFLHMVQGLLNLTTATLLSVVYVTLLLIVYAPGTLGCFLEICAVLRLLWIWAFTCFSVYLKCFSHSSFHLAGSIHPSGFSSCRTTSP